MINAGKRLGTAFALTVLFWSNGPPSTANAEDKLPFLLGADVSLAPRVEAAGVVYKDGGKPKDIYALFRDRGANCIRLRLFVHPDGKRGVVNDLPYTVALAKRIKAAGLIFSLDFHYSDTWADPGHQIIPAEWRDLPFPQLIDRTREYTAQTIRAFRAAGVMPQIVQIGNEITNGMMWPAGKLGGKELPDARRFDAMSALLKAGAEGVRLGAEGAAMPKLMIHIDRGANQAKVNWFFENLCREEVPFDLIGLSFYPFYDGDLDALRGSLASLARTFHKPIVIAETAYFSADSPWIKADQRKNFKFPLTPQGQKEFLQTLIRAMRETPDSLGGGVLWWYPESVPVHDPAVDTWERGDAAMFDRAGNALPVFEAFSSQTR